MDVSAMASAISANAQARVQDQVSIAVLKQALDMQQQSAMQLLEALPQVPSSSGQGVVSAAGGLVDVYA